MIMSCRNTVFMIINTVYAFQIAYARRPISFDHNERTWIRTRIEETYLFAFFATLSLFFRLPWVRR